MAVIWFPPRRICSRPGPVAAAAIASPSVETADILVQFAQFALNAKSDPARATKLFGEALDIYRSASGQPASVGGRHAERSRHRGDLDGRLRVGRALPAAGDRDFPGDREPQLSRSRRRLGEPGLYPDAARKVRGGRAVAERGAANRAQGIRRRQRAGGPDRIAPGNAIRSARAMRHAPSRRRRMPSRSRASGSDPTIT